MSRKQSNFPRGATVRAYNARAEKIMLGVVEDSLATQYFINFEDGSEGFVWKDRDGLKVEKVGMTPQELLAHVGWAHYGEPEIQRKAAAVAKTDLDDETKAEACRRIRKITMSLVLQDRITEVLQDGWKPTKSNSAIQPFVSKE